MECLEIKQTKRVLVATILISLFSLTLFAQINTGRISGAVTDQSGGAIAGAKVTVIDVARGETRPLVADAAGVYAAPNLNPGTYTLRVEFMGFKTEERQNVEVDVGGDVRVDLTLQPGEQTQTVTVTEALPVINTTNAQTGGVLENQLITDLPLNGRNYRSDIQLIPGVMLGFGTNAVTVDMNGTTDSHAGNYMVDGLYDQSFFTADTTFGSAGEAGFGTILPLDAIQEVNLAVNPKAEYGWIPGATTSIGLKSGTNDMHGDAYAFGRDTALDARNAFATARTPLTFEQFGATLGGPIKKNKLFYFGGYEGFREAASSIVSEVAPTTADLGNSSNATGLSIPDAIADINAKGFNSMLSQLSLNLAGCNPTKITSSMTTGTAVVASGACNANQFGGPGLWNNPNLGNVPDNGHSDNGLFKLDYHVNDHHTLNGSFAYGTYEENAAGNSAAKITQNYWEEVLGVIGEMGRIVEIWSPNSAWLNEARWGVDYAKRPVGRAECSPNGDLSNPTGVGGSTGGYGGPNYVTQYGLLSGAPGCGIPTMTLASPVTAQLGFSNARLDNETDEQGADSLSYTRGLHQFKFGVDIRALSVTGAKVLDSQSGVIAFGTSGDAAFSKATSLEDFLAGVPSSETIRSASAVRSISTNLIAAFAEDDWRITPRLTMNLGIREEIVTNPTSNTDNLGNFSPSSPTGIIAITGPFKTHYDFEPRLGLAWDVTGKGTTTLRAGIGVLNALATLMNFISGGAAANFDNVPTGETLCPAAGCANALIAPGDGKSAFETLIPVSNGTTVTSSPIFWPKTNTNPLTSLFPTPIPTQCGNGLTSTANPAVINPSPCTMAGADPNLHYYHYIFWNVNFEHAFTNTLSVDVGYVASRSTGILQTINLNQSAPTDNNTLNTSSSEQARAPYETMFPWFSSINYQGNNESDNYRSLQVSVVKRVSHGLTFTTAYTYAGNYLTQGILNVNLPIAGDGPYGDNNYPAHNLSFTATYSIPGIKSPGQMLEGWQLHTNVSVISSLGFTLSDSKDDLTGAGATPWTMYGPAAPFNQVFGRAGTVPCYGVSGITTSSLAKAPCILVPAGAASTPWTNLPAACIAGATNEPSFPGAAVGTNTQQGLPLWQLATTGCYMVNGSAMVPPAQGTYGTMLPDSIRGAGQGLVDASVTKEWKIKERFTTQFRAEVFNLLNRTQYKGAGTNLGSPTTLGLATNTPDINSGDPIQGRGGPRAIQLGLKVLF